MPIIDKWKSYLIICGDLVILTYIFLLHGVIALLPEKPPRVILEREGNDMGVGIALSPSYGTISVRYADGSFIDIAQVQGDTAYVKAIKRLSTETTRRATRRFHATLPDAFYDQTRVLWRDLRKKFGLPATRDVKLLGGILWDLRREARRRLGVDVNAVLLATPDVPGLYEEDAVDAIQYAGLVPLGRAHRLSFNLRETNTAYIGYGNGLSDDYYRDSTVKRNTPSPSDEVLFVELTKKCLLLDRGSLWSPNRIPTDSPRDVYIDYDLGTDYADDPIYWNKVRDCIREMIEKVRPFEPCFSKVLIAGEGASQALWDVVAEVVGDYGNPKIYLSGPTYVAARGAAELARRSLLAMQLMNNDNPYRYTSDEEAKRFLTPDNMAAA